MSTDEDFFDELNMFEEFEFDEYPKDETDDPEYLNHLANLGLNIPGPSLKKGE